MSVLASIWAWLLRHPAFGVLGLLIAHVALHQFIIDPRLRADRDTAQAAAAKWRTATFAWKGAYERFARDVQEQRAAAAEADRRNTARVEAEQAVIIERTKDAYEDRLADTRAAERELRDQLGRAALAAQRDGGGGAADVPGSFEARCRAFGAADCDALLAALPGQLAAAEKNTAKLIGLQDYVRGVLAIDWNGAGDASPGQPEARDAEQ